jgi:hypothetical protein
MVFEDADVRVVLLDIGTFSLGGFPAHNRKGKSSRGHMTVADLISCRRDCVSDIFRSGCAGEWFSSVCIYSV